MTFDLFKVECSSKGLTLIGENALKVRANKIADVPGVEILDLSHNNIVSLDWIEVKYLTGLKLLIINNNMISELLNNHSTTFYHTIETMDLNNNSLTIIDLNIISEKITSIFLNDNPIKEIEPLKKEDTSIKRISMHNSDISSLDLSKFNGMMNLNILDLKSTYNHGHINDKQKIIWLNTTLNELNIPNLKILDLSGNDIFQPTVDLSNLISLRTLDLSNNLISTIEKETFIGILSKSSINMLRINDNLLHCNTPWWCWMHNRTLEEPRIVSKIALEYINCYGTNLKCILTHCHKDITLLINTLCKTGI